MVIIDSLSDPRLAGKDLMLLWTPLRLGSIAALTFRSPCTFIEAEILSAVSGVAGHSRRRASINDQSIPMSPSSKQGDEQIKWIIRPATLADREGVTSLLQQSYGTLLRADYTEDCLAQYLPLISQPRDELLTCNTWYVVQDPSTHELVGCGGWTVDPPKSPDGTIATIKESNLSQFVPHLRHFAVHPNYLRRGIASDIWNCCKSAIEARCAAENVPFPTLEVFSTLTAESFYKSLGFEQVSRIDLELVPGATFPSILMRREPL
jgi:GNAT superfamily N-acetyltransferase